jgi:hypothetical protein
MTRIRIQITSSLVLALVASAAFVSTAYAQDDSEFPEETSPAGEVEDARPEGVSPPATEGEAAAEAPEPSPTTSAVSTAAPQTAGVAWERPPPHEFATDAPGSGPHDGTLADDEVRDVSRDRLLHGFRLGWMFTTNADAEWEDGSDESYRDHYNLRSEHQFIFGYELTWRMIGHEWLNVLLVGNLLVAGVEQSRFFPSMNGLLGFELHNTFQIGVGVSLTPTKERATHMLAAFGWTPRVGGFYLPVHFFFVPDPYGHHRLGLTMGVNF